MVFGVYNRDVTLVFTKDDRLKLEHVTLILFMQIYIYICVYTYMYIYCVMTGIVFLTMLCVSIGRPGGL